MVESALFELQSLRNQLRDIYSAMVAFGSAQLVAKPPILDSSLDPSNDGNEEFLLHQDAIHGLRALRDAVRRDLDVLEKFLDTPKCASLPALSTNAPYLISVWNEVLHAPPPIVTIWRTFPEGDGPTDVPRRGSRKPPGVKIDVVAEGGKRWIRVNTTKNSRLQAEFREIDSYMTEDEGSDDECYPSLAQEELDNTILRMGRSLLDAARRNPLPESKTAPSITMRLTRLHPSSSNAKECDVRIAQTIDTLRAMGIEVQLGERDPAQLPKVSSPPARHLEPTVRINLDLSILIALVSDITHSPLPVSSAEADSRYVPSAHYREWKRKRLEASKRPDEDFDESRLGPNGIGKHSRALANQALQEMGRGLLEELHGRLSAVSAIENVEFWTTPEARDRCLRIVLSKIGGPNEKRRAAALFPADEQQASSAVDEYWTHSRYPRAFLPLIPIHVFPSSIPPSDIVPASLSEDRRALSPFFKLLARISRDILAQETMPHPRTSPIPKADQSLPATDEDDSSEEIERAVVTKANPRLTAHTVQSMLWGAARGWTTLTANKSSVKAIIRDIRAVDGGYGWGQEVSANHMDMPEQGGSVGGESVHDGVTAEKVALWVMDPRSLAEGMRSDYSEL